MKTDIKHLFLPTTFQYRIYSLNLSFNLAAAVVHMVLGGGSTEQVEYKLAALVVAIKVAHRSPETTRRTCDGIILISYEEILFGG